jgi:hypothetical protein
VKDDVAGVIGQTLTDGGELSRVASTARVNTDALIEWVSQARSLELDEVMGEVLAPSHPEQTSWDVKAVFTRLEERAARVSARPSFSST